MYRNSPEARQLMKRLPDMPGNKGRRLERWDQEHMLWSKELQLSLGRKAEHCRQLMVLARRGKDNDRAARIMLSRCSPPARTRDALAKMAGYASAADITAEPLVNACTDAGWDQIEREASDIQRLIDEGVNPGLPRVFREWTQMVMQWIEAGASNVCDVMHRVEAGTSNIREELTEPLTPEQVKHSMGTNVLAWGISDGPYDLSWMYALAGVEPSSDDVDLTDASYLFEGGLFNYGSLAITEAPLPLLMTMASAGSHFLQAMGEARPTPVLNDADDRDELAAVMAPLLIGLVKTARPEVRETILRDIDTASCAEPSLPADYAAELAVLRDYKAAG